jgi:glycosyltransferase involved in cell wall biosynthesis
MMQDERRACARVAGYHPTGLSNGVTGGTAGELVSIVVPVYNEQDTIAAVVRRLLTIALPVPREIIIINDGSRDGTAEALARLPDREREPLTVIDLEHNRGKGHAVRLGFARARGTIVAIQDADLELDPAQIASLVAPILDGRTAVVYGSRFLTRRTGPLTLGYAANRGLTWLTNALFGSSLTDMETCYKVMRTEVARALPLTADRFDIEPEITARLIQAGHRIVEVPVSFSPRSRAAGKKIGWRDGVAAVAVLVRCRLRKRPGRRPGGGA